MGIPNVIIVALGARLTRRIGCVAAAALGFLHRQEFIGMPLATVRVATVRVATVRANAPVRSCQKVARSAIVDRR